MSGTLPSVVSAVICDDTGNYWGDHGWYRGDSDDARAKAAYDALLRIGLYESKSPLFDEFSTELKRRAKLEYDFDYGQEKVCVVSLRLPRCMWRLVLSKLQIHSTYHTHARTHARTHAPARARTHIRRTIFFFL